MSFPVWKTIEIGHKDRYGHSLFKTVRSLLTSLEEKGITINQVPEMLLDQNSIILADSPKKVKLAKIRPEDLGLKNGCTLSKFYSKAKKTGLSLCTPEIALHLRNQYLDQEPSESLHITMEPLTHSSDFINKIFGIGASSDDTYVLCIYASVIYKKASLLIDAIKYYPNDTDTMIDGPLIFQC